MERGDITYHSSALGKPATSTILCEVHSHSLTDLAASSPILSHGLGLPVASSCTPTTPPSFRVLIWCLPPRASSPSPRLLCYHQSRHVSDAFDRFYPALLNFLFLFVSIWASQAVVCCSVLTPLAEDGGQRQGLGFSSACTAGIPTVADFMLPPTWSHWMWNWKRRVQLAPGRPDQWQSIQQTSTGGRLCPMPCATHQV